LIIYPDDEEKGADEQTAKSALKRPYVNGGYPMHASISLRSIARSLVVGAAMLGLALPPAASAQTQMTAVNAGPIWNQADAEKKCPRVAVSYGGVWNGQWRTTVPGKMSVCEVKYVGKPGKYWALV
jgi:hypothetical protein